MLKTEELSYRHEGRWLIQKINLCVKPGTVFGILGPNGSGKSTLLKSLAGIWTPTSGKVLWQGKDLLQNSRKEISRIITLVPQNPQVFFDFSVADIILMGRYPYGSPNKDPVHLLDSVLDTVDASHLRHRSIANLSQGEKKRVYIARALITESPILLLDEPTASLDIRHQLDVWQLIKRLAQNGKVVIITSHDLAMTKQYCDEVAILNYGNCVATGSYTETLTPRRLQEVFGVRESI